MDKLSTAVQYLREYVAIPSVNPMGRADMDPQIVGESRYAERVKQDLQRVGVSAELVGQGSRQSVVADLRSSKRDAETVVIASHLDTVPIDGMTIDPFDPVVSGGRLSGRGACDTKAGMAALMAAVENVLRRGRLRRNVILVGESDEEMSSVGVFDVLEHLAGRRVDWALATEPTGLRVVNAHKGRATLDLKCIGRAGHSSEPDKADNAIVTLARTVVALEELQKELRERADARLGAGTVAVTLIAGGQASNVIPDQATLTLDRRTLPEDTLEQLEAEVRAVLARAGLAQRVEIVDAQFQKHALGTAPEHPAVRHCQQALRDCALPAVLGTVAFGTDAGPLAAHGIPGIVMGPGEIEQAHTADEWIATDQVEAMARFFERLLTGEGESAADGGA